MYLVTGTHLISSRGTVFKQLGEGFSSVEFICTRTVGSSRRHRFLFSAADGGLSLPTIKVALGFGACHGKSDLFSSTRAKYESCTSYFVSAKSALVDSLSSRQLVRAMKSSPGEEFQFTSYEVRVQRKATYE